jgi:hypothetical protein
MCQPWSLQRSTWNFITTPPPSCFSAHFGAAVVKEGATHGRAKARVVAFESEVVSAAMAADF